MSRRVLAVVCVGVLLVVAVVAVLVVRSRDGADTRLARAAEMAPAGSARLSWTDWSGIREELDADVSMPSSPAGLDRFLADGFDADLTSTSAILESAGILHKKYAVSPANLDWELLAQGTEGALLLMGLPDSVDLEELADTLAELGYDEPGDEGGVWEGTDELLAGLGVPSPQLTFLSIDAERRVLVAGDELAYVAEWRDHQRAGDDVADDDGMAAVVEAAGAALSASVYTGDHACTALAMSQADGPDRARASQLIEEAGEINPLRGFAIAARAGGDVRVAMAFETDEQARTNADTRAALASGPAPGQGGSFADRFELRTTRADGRVVTMELIPVEGSFPLSDLASGPVLFATC